MIPEQRRRQIVELVATGELTRVDDLADALGVSGETVRRDLLVLDRRGEIHRVYGGAVAATQRAVEASFEQRQVDHMTCKRAMATLAGSLIGLDDTVMFDVGTSVTEVAKRLPDEFRGLLLTNSLPAASELSTYQEATLLLSGGRVRGGDLACSNQHAVDFFTGYYADTAFLGSGGVHPDAGLTDYYPDEIAVRRVMLEHATKTYVLADCSKLGHIAVGNVCPLSTLTGVITDGHAEPEAVDRLTDAGVRVLVAPVPAAASVPEGEAS